MNGALLMGKHDHPDDVWVPQYRGYQCEGCKEAWASVQLDEGVMPEGLLCLATERCRGPVVALIPTEEPPPDWIPLVVEWFKPKSNIHFLGDARLNDYLRKGGLLSRPTVLAPDWVKARIGYFGGLRTF